MGLRIEAGNSSSRSKVAPVFVGQTPTTDNPPGCGSAAGLVTFILVGPVWRRSAGELRLDSNMGQIGASVHLLCTLKG